MNRFFNKPPQKKRIIQYYDAHRNIYAAERHFLLFKISKVASTTLWLFMAKLLGHSVKPREINLPFIQGWDINNHPEVFKAGFVRNPWDRLLSCYLQKKKYNRQGFYEKTNLSRDMDFTQFAKAVCAIPDSIADQHFRSQYTFVVDRKGAVIADFIGRLEHFDEDFKSMCQLAHLPETSLPKKNSTQHDHYTSYYTPELAAAVAQRYAIDLQLFGYEFGQPLSDTKRYRWKEPIPELLQLQIVQAKNQKLLYGLNSMRTAKVLERPGKIRRVKNFILGR